MLDVIGLISPHSSGDLVFNEKPSAGSSFAHIPPLFWRGISTLLGGSCLVFAIDNAVVSEPSHPVIGLAYLSLGFMLLLGGILGWQRLLPSLHSSNSKDGD